MRVLGTGVLGMGVGRRGLGGGQGREDAQRRGAGELQRRRGVGRRQQGLHAGAERAGAGTDLAGQRAQYLGCRAPGEAGDLLELAEQGAELAHRERGDVQGLPQLRGGREGDHVHRVAGPAEGQRGRRPGRAGRDRRGRGRRRGAGHGQDRHGTPCTGEADPGSASLPKR